MRLIHWNEVEAKQKVDLLRSAGYLVKYDKFTPDLLRERQDPPNAIIIDLSRLPSQGRDAAMALKVLKRAQEALAHTEFKHDPLDQTLRAAAQELGIKAGQMFQPIRVAVCGRKNAPPLFETLVVLGKETTLRRIEQAIQNVA